ncbi:hypothetical protein CANCADRAFT_12426, partial [Tortispora caseinolytica NRRL Y-17796]
ENDSDDEDEGQEDEEIVNSSMSIASMILLDSELSQESRDLANTLNEKLEYIAEHGTPVLQSATHTLRIALDTICTTDTSEPSTSAVIYKQAIEKLSDPLVPVKAHGLNNLKTLVNKRDPIIDPTKVSSIVLRLMKDDDSFVYLNCVKVLESLARVYGSEILDRIFVAYTSKTELDQRLRYGEAIEKCLRIMGELFWRDKAQYLCLQLIRIAGDSKLDFRWRMSSLSILGVACESNLSGLSGIVWPITDCALSILTFDNTNKQESIILRRAALVLIASIFRSMESFGDFPQDKVRSTISTLRYLSETEFDSVAKDQATTILDIIKD